MTKIARRLVSEHPREEPLTSQIDRALSRFSEETRGETCEGSLRILLLDYRQFGGGDHGVHYLGPGYFRGSVSSAEGRISRDGRGRNDERCCRLRFEFPEKQQILPLGIFGTKHDEQERKFNPELGLDLMSGAMTSASCL